MGRILLALGVVVLAGAWVAPAAVVAVAGTDLAAQNGIELSIDGTLPALPLGFQIDRLGVAYRGKSITIENAAVRLYPSGWNVTGELASGSVDARGPLDGRSGWVQFHRIAVEQLPLELPSGLVLRGRASGAATWEGDDLAISGRLLTGSVAFMLVPVSFDAVDIVARRETDRSISLTSIAVTGPAVEVTGSGRLDPTGAVDVMIDLLRLEDPLLSVVSMVDAAPNQIPTRFAIQGRLPRPQVRELPPPPENDAFDGFDDPF